MKKEEMKTSALYPTPEHSLAGAYLSQTEYPWEALPHIGEWVTEIGKTLPPSVYEKRGDNVWIAKSAAVAPTATLKGPLIIGENTEVRPGAFIRGNVLVGRGAVVGNSTELKNCILFDGVQVPHFNYVGDSVLGYKAHLGAGAITSNVKGDKTPVTVRCGEEKIQTGCQKCGAMLGDFVDVGCNSVLNPGTVVGKNTNIYPLSSVRGFVPADSIYKSATETVKKR